MTDETRQSPADLVSHGDRIRWPRKWRGWRMLFWLWLGRCPIHHTPLNVDNALYDDGVSAYCFRCDGVAVWPQGAREALRQNYRAEAAKQLTNSHRPEGS